MKGSNTYNYKSELAQGRLNVIKTFPCNPPVCVLIFEKLRNKKLIRECNGIINNDVMEMMTILLLVDLLLKEEMVGRRIYLSRNGDGNGHLLESLNVATCTLTS